MTAEETIVEEMIVQDATHKVVTVEIAVVKEADVRIVARVTPDASRKVCSKEDQHVNA